MTKHHFGKNIQKFQSFFHKYFLVLYGTITILYVHEGKNALFDKTDEHYQMHLHRYAMTKALLDANLEEYKRGNSRTV